MEMYYTAMHMKDQLLLSLRDENLSVALLLIGTTFVVLLMSLYLKKKSGTTYKRPIRLISSVFILIFLMPYFFVAFVVFYAPLYSITFPPDLLTGSIIFGGICLFYSVIKLINVSAKIFSREAYKNVVKKHDSKQNLIDSFTGLYNRAGFFTLTEHHMRLARRDNRKVFLLYAKMDRLKQVHDKLGYQDRDMAILEASKLMTSSFRNSDIIARVSEDAFIIFLIGCTDDNVDGVSTHFNGRYNAMNAGRNEKYRVSIRYCVVDYCPKYNNEFDNILARAKDLLLLKTNTTLINSAVNCHTDDTKSRSTQYGESC